MKHNALLIVLSAALSAVVCGTSCDRLLDKVPSSSVSPEKYLNEASQLGYYVNGLYPNILPSHSGYDLTFVKDQYTDNQAYVTPSSRYVKNSWTVPGSGSWYFKNIYDCNYFLGVVVPRFEEGRIGGNTIEIRQYIAEVYFLRAYEYFVRYQDYGDFPIVENILPDEESALVEASRRCPRNEVARFILSDLDRALEYMPEQFESRHTRINRNCVLLLKSRVALYEGTFLKYFKGTPFVPHGEGWPGEGREYSRSYEYPSGGIDAEINCFLDVAMNAAAELSDGISLVGNTGTVQQSGADAPNPYMDMFASADLSSFPEVLLWRQYDQGMSITNACGEWGNRGNLGAGITRGMVDSFLMANGLPIYDPASGYAGDDYIADVRADRDSRLTIFLKEPGQNNSIDVYEGASQAVGVEPYPNLFGSDFSRLYSTGYSIRKGNPLNQIHLVGNAGSYVASVTFRGVEALLNYIEACYERTGALDGRARQYWEAIRLRARVDTDIDRTIAATDMTKEAANDWGAYSAGRLVDPVLYNIRRERRCELMAEGLREMDLHRWRSYDQLIENPYHIEGFKLWGPMKGWYGNQLKYGSSDANVSAPSRSKYLRPYEKTESGEAYDGLTWSMAHYLQPLSIQEMILTSENRNVDDLSVSESLLADGKRKSSDKVTMKEPRLDIRAIASGDLDSFESLYIAYYGRVLTYTSFLLRNPVKAEDATQDVFLKIWKNRESLREGMSPSAYIYQTARRTVLDILRDDRYADRYRSWAVENSSEEKAEDSCFREIEELAFQAVEDMPPRRKEIFLMSRREGLSCDEIAGKLGLSKHTINRHIGLALLSLKGKLEDYLQK